LYCFILCSPLPETEQANKEPPILYVSSVAGEGGAQNIKAPGKIVSTLQPGQNTLASPTHITNKRVMFALNFTASIRRTPQRCWRTYSFQRQSLSLLRVRHWSSSSELASTPNSTVRSLSCSHIVRVQHPARSCCIHMWECTRWGPTADSAGVYSSIVSNVCAHSCSIL